MNKIKPKKGMSATKRNFIWDIGIGLGFLLVFSQEITGETLHEWLALALFAGLATHIILHWKWIVNISRRLFSKKLPLKTRLSYLVNGGLVLAFGLMGFSGLAISESVLPALGLSGGGSELWEGIHEAAANMALLMVGGHLLLHWKWIVTHTGKYLLNGRQLPTRLPDLFSSAIGR